MGGCCCCAFKGSERNHSPIFLHYPGSEESQPLSAHHATTQPAVLLVDTNLDTTVPDTYHPPPAPIPYESYTARPPTPIRNRESTCNKTDTVLPASNTQPVGVVNSVDNLEAKVKDIECEEKGSANVELGTLEDEISDDPKKSIEPMVPPLPDEEDVCPTCLEEYDEQNPRIITKCEHHFHLACIYEWMERSDTCPVCDQEMIFSPIIGG